MGCSESAAVVANQPKPIKPQQMTVPVNTAIKQKTEEQLHFLIGHIKEEEYVFAKVSLTKRSIDRLNIPQNFSPHNYSCMLQYQPKKYLISGGINFSLTDITNKCYLYDSTTHSVKQIAKMNQPRYTHSSIYFKNRVYTIGGRYFGEDEQAILNVCEKYSFDSNQWSVVASMNVKRCTCYVLAWHESIYVFGGYTGKFQRDNTIERLVQKQNKWEILNFTLNRGIESAFTTCFRPNEITIFGGNTNAGTTSSVASINLHQQSIISHHKLSQQKTLHKSFRCNDNVFMFGGSQNCILEIYNFENKTSQIVDIKLSEQFDPQNFQILTQSEDNLVIPYSKTEPTKLISSQDDQVILIFGTTEQPFILQLNVSVPFSQIYSVPLSLRLHSQSGGVNLKNLCFILFGGIEDDSLSFVSSSTYFYNHKTREVRQLAKMTVARYSFAYEKINNRVYAIGGGNSDEEGILNILDHCEFYDIQKQIWISVCKLPLPLISAISLNFKNTLYVFGGITTNKQRNKLMFKYDSEKDKWETLLFQFSFGIEAAGLYQIKQTQFLIFGGRLDNGDSDGIWSLIFTQNGTFQCILTEKGRMNCKRSKLKIFKPKTQNFIVSFGGSKDPISYYDIQSLKVMQWDGLRNLTQVFLAQMQQLNSQDLKNYLTLCKN